MNVSGLTQFDPSKFFQTPATASAPQRLDTKVSAVSTSADLTGRLTVTTAEGDKITLTADLEAQFRAVNYQGQVQTDNGTVDVKAKSVEASLKQQFGVTVEGDLNDQELHDLAKLFRKVTNIFRKFFNGQDDEAQAKTARLAEKFGNLSSLSGLDLSVDVQRSVTVVAAQVSSQTTGQPTAVPDQTAQPAASTAQTGTPSEAPAVSSETSSPATDPTPAKSASADSTSAGDSTLRLAAPAQDDVQTKSLAQQVLDALQDSKVDLQKTRKYLPDFFKKLREDLDNQLQSKQAQNDSKPDTQPATAPDPTTPPAPAGVTAAVFAYQSFSQTSIRLSIHS